MTTPLDLAAIRARLDAAVQGPYTVEHVRATTPGSHGVETSSSTIRDGGGCWICEVPGDIRTAEFLAAARTDVGDLLDECVRLRGEIADMHRNGRYITNDEAARDAARFKAERERDAAIAELARLRAELLAEDAVIEAVLAEYDAADAYAYHRNSADWSRLDANVQTRLLVAKNETGAAAIAAVAALRAARAGKDGG